MDSSSAGNHNKVKVMATQLLAKFEENAPAQQTGLKRQVGGSHVLHCDSSGSDGREGAFSPLMQKRHRIGIQAFCTVIVVL